MTFQGKNLNKGQINKISSQGFPGKIYNAKASNVVCTVLILLSTAEAFLDVPGAHSGLFSRQGHYLPVIYIFYEWYIIFKFQNNSNMKKILQVSRGNRPFLKGQRIRISPEFSKIILKFKSQFNGAFGIIIIIFSIFLYAQANH